MYIYIVRHGETEYNLCGKLQGRSDIPLSEAGKESARRASERLKGIAFRKAYTSPLVRAVETAEIILAGRDIPIVKEARIQEISFGIYEGLVWRGEGIQLPDLGFLDFFHNPQEYIPPEGGESIESLCARTGAFLEELKRGNLRYAADDAVLLTTHGAALRSLISVALGREKKDFWQGGIPKNCQAAILKIERDHITVIEEGRNEL